MLCLPAFGDHEALKRDTSTSKNGCFFHHRDDHFMLERTRVIPLVFSPLDAQMLYLPAFGDHEALKRHTSTSKNGCFSP